MFNLLGATKSFSESKFWALYTFSATLLSLDCVTTVIILEFCGGIELNPVVKSIGLFNITIYKLLANAFIGYVSRTKKILWLLSGLSMVFTFVVLWNVVNIFLVL
jgi:hypothetical protein